MHTLDERALVTQAKTDPQAFAQLYDRYVDRIYAYAYRQVQDSAVAQDITAVTFEKALRHIRRYQWQGKSVVAWLYRIARNEAISFHRRQRWMTPWQRKGQPPKQSPPQRELETAVFNTQQYEQLHAAIGALSPNDQEIITLRYFEALTSEEVAELLGCSTANAYVRLHRALKRLHSQLTRLETEGAKPHVKPS